MTLHRNWPAGAAIFERGGLAHVLLIGGVDIDFAADLVLIREHRDAFFAAQPPGQFGGDGLHAGEQFIGQRADFAPQLFAQRVGECIEANPDLPCARNVDVDLGHQRSLGGR